jgi:hypothetical protein
MANTPVQTYANHVHRPQLFAVAFVATVAAFAFFFTEMVRFRGPLMYGALSLAVAVMCLTLISRVYIVRLQDRIIRLEMQVRMARLGLEPLWSRLSVKQLVALRFASDAELPGLAQRAAAEALSPRDIKKAVTDWQADWLRT